MKGSRIEWTDHTFNPWIGCTKVSPGCVNCYADAQDQRRKWTPAGWGAGRPRRRTSAAYWEEPLRWNKQGVCTACGAHQALNARQPHRLPDGTICGERGREIVQTFRRPRVFCASLADWLDEEVPVEWFVDLLWLIYRTPNLDWQLLTKRPQNWAARLAAAIDVHRRQPRIWTKEHAWFRQWMIDWSNVDKGPPHPLVQPPGNVWIGTTAEDQVRANERVPALLRIPARVRFLSCEPLLGPVNLVAHVERRGAHFKTLAGTGVLGPDEPRVHWVIAGGESGPDARPMHPDWALSLRDQCEISETAFFFKQWGEWKRPSGWDVWKTVPASIWVHRQTAATWQKTGRPREVVGDCETEEEAAEWALMERAGKKLAGRLLDDREWNETPTVGRPGE